MGRGHISRVSSSDFLQSMMGSHWRVMNMRSDEI
jgi:hypothetical protein